MYIQENNIIDCSSKSTTLSDKKKNGEERPWREKKIASVAYYELLEILTLKKAERVSLCGDILEFDVTTEGEMKLAKAWFCKSSLCPMCNWRKSMKLSVQATKVVTEVIRQKPNARWLFLTLTLKNVYGGEQLDNSLKEMAIGFNRLMKYKKVQKNMVGFMRSTEVTVNSKDGSYNQHMHVLLSVESMYFKNSDNYIDQREWTSLWQKAMKLEYVPVVHIEAVRDKRKKELSKLLLTDVQSAIQETAKYSVKDSDYLTGNQERDLEVVQDLETGLHRKRMISYGGLLKQVHKELNLDDAEKGDLVHVDDEKDDIQKKAYSIVAKWNWRQKNYYLRS
ncbi:protein rep [Lysinibacillus capsici]|uniref:protein rep n=1 Tax=Lysinibacillus capsici TaxID=2115968 RepID=UPI003CCC1BA5